MAEIISCIPLRTGRNNQVFKLELGETRNWDRFCQSAKKFGLELSPPHVPFPVARTLILKRYFRHPEDLRPRLKSEYTFLSFAEQYQIEPVPKPLISNSEENWGLYSFIEGEVVVSEEVTEKAVKQALDFFLQLNRHKEHASHLSLASEACTGSQDYLESVEKRIGKILSAGNERVNELIRKELLPKWEQRRSLPNWTLRSEQLCVTPSDFGFHNALLHEGNFYFLDFEYAGWDDPAKTASDFFCQPKIPVPMNYFENSCRAIASAAAHPELCLERIKLVFPICQIKWCCIMLGGILGIGKARRSFAQCEEQEQLEKTREYLCRI